MIENTDFNFFDINSVVIIGASESEGKIGNDLLKNLNDFSGEKMGVNPKGGSYDGIVFHTSISELPIIPDIAVITIPARFVLGSLKECGEKGIKRIIIISAGFKEVGNIEGEQAIKDISKEYGMRVLGPNCLGYVDVHKKLNLSFGGKGVSKGDIAMISQSGAMAVALTDWASSINLGFSKLISMGNKADIDENDLLEGLVNDPETKVIAIYLESLENGRAFFEITKKLSKLKPIVLIKSGLSQRGKAAATSHTGALSGENEVLTAAFHDAGIHTTSSLENFFLWADAFSETGGKEIPESLAIITNAGGPGVMATDHCEFNKITLQDFSEEEQEILKTNMPDSSCMKNPIDIIGDATSVRYKQILENFTKIEKNIGILVLLTPQTVTDVDNIADEIISFRNKNKDLFLMTSCMGGISIHEARDKLRGNCILDYDYPRKGIIMMSKLVSQKKWEKEPVEKQFEFLAAPETDIQKINNKLKLEDKLCSLSTTADIFHAFNVTFLEDKLAVCKEDVDKIWDDSGKKLVAKVASKDIAHKTDCGGVVIGITSKQDAVSAYNNILESSRSYHPDADISGVTFQDMLPKSKEIFVGMKRDISFGEVLVVGMGGIFVNVYEDVSLKLAPVSKDGIKKMIEGLKGFPILNGARGDTQINFDALVDMVYKIESVFHAFPQIKEIDINPAFANEKSCIIVDAKLYL